VAVCRAARGRSNEGDRHPPPRLRPPLSPMPVADHETQRQLDALQAQYAAQGAAAGSSVRAFHEMMRSNAAAPPETAYERFLAQKAAANTHQSSDMNPKRQDYMLLKDGLDMTFRTMMNDASRMRANLSELGVALGQEQRAKVAERVEQMPLPPSIAEQFSEQQRVLVEQRRVLEQLRHERNLEESDRFWTMRNNRARYHGTDGGDNDPSAPPPIAPDVMNEAQRMLRGLPPSMLHPDATTALIPARDGYLLVEFEGLEGFLLRQLDGTSYGVRVLGGSSVSIATAGVDGPVDDDGTLHPRKVQVTIPSSSAGKEIDVEVSIRGTEGNATAVVPFRDIREDRGEAQLVKLTPTGSWATPEAKLFIKVAICGVAPTDEAGHQLAHTRVVQSQVSCPRSDYPGPELGPSQAHCRQQYRDWERRGRPEVADDIETLVQAPAQPGRQVGGKAPAQPGAAQPTLRATPVKPETPSESEGDDEGTAEEEPEPGIFGGIFAGFRERGAPTASEEPEPLPPMFGPAPVEEPEPAPPWSGRLFGSFGGQPARAEAIHTEEPEPAPPWTGGFFAGFGDNTSPGAPAGPTEEPEPTPRSSGFFASLTERFFPAEAEPEPVPEKAERSQSLGPAAKRSTTPQRQRKQQQQRADVTPPRTRYHQRQEQKHQPQQPPHQKQHQQRKQQEQQLQRDQQHRQQKQQASITPPRTRDPQRQQQRQEQNDEVQQNWQQHVEQHFLPGQFREEQVQHQEQGCSRHRRWATNRYNPGENVIASFSGFQERSEDSQPPIMAFVGLHQPPDRGGGKGGGGRGGVGARGGASRSGGGGGDFMDALDPTALVADVRVALGFESAADATARRKATEAAEVRLQLHPPNSTMTLSELFTELRASFDRGLLGTKEVAQDVLEFAARCSSKSAIARENISEAMLSQYAAMLLDALYSYIDSPTLCMWTVEGLVSIFNHVEDHRAQLGIPLFNAFAHAAVKFEGQPEVIELHCRLLAGLATVASPDCCAEPPLIDYVLTILEHAQGRLPPLTAEHALAVLCAVRSSHRIGTQIRHTLLLLRGFKSDVYLATRMLVTVAELYEVMSDEIEKEEGARQAAREQAEADGYVPNEKVVSCFDRGVPPGGVDVRLASTVLDLYPGHRKVAGAAIRALSAMCRISSEHLHLVMTADLRALVAAQRRHVVSRSVNLHIAEAVLLAAEREPEIIGTAATLVVAATLRAFPQDPEVAASALEAMSLIAQRGQHVRTVIDSVPPTELVTIGEAHATNTRVNSPLCTLLGTEAMSSNEIREDIINSGAIAVPLRALNFIHADPGFVLAALRSLKCLAFRSREALQQVAHLRGAKILIGVLERHATNPEIVHPVLQAISAICKLELLRLQLVSVENPESFHVLDKILHAACATANQDADILAQACCALGTLTASEHEQDHSRLVKAIDNRLMSTMVARVEQGCPEYAGGLAYCGRVIAVAAGTELYAGRMLSESGAEVTSLPSAAPRKDPLKGKRIRKPRDMPEKVGVDDEEYDIFAPLRGLGLGPMSKLPQTASVSAPQVGEVASSPQNIHGGGEGGRILSGHSPATAAGGNGEGGLLGGLFGGGSDEASGNTVRGGTRTSRPRTFKHKSDEPEEEDVLGLGMLVGMLGGMVGQEEEEQRDECDRSSGFF